MHVIRRVENHFAPDNLPRWRGMIEFLQYFQFRYKIPLQTAENGGEYRIGSYLVDGFNKSKSLVIEYNGCWFHGHECFLNKPKNDGKEALRKSRSERTAARTRTIQGLGYRVMTMNECLWLTMKKHDKDVKVRCLFL